MPNDPTLRAAVEFHQAGRLMEAERIYRQILAGNPEDPAALHLLGLLAADAGKPDAGIALIRRAIALRPAAADFHSNLGDVLRRSGRLDESIAACRQAVCFNPDFIEAHINLGNALMDKGDLISAVAEYREAARLRPTSAFIWNYLGNALSQNGENDEAIMAYQTAARLAPDSAEAYNGLGDVLSSKGQLDAAVAACQRAIKLNPQFAIAHNTLGCALARQGKHASAADSFQKAIEIDPDFAEAHINLGVCYFEMRRLDDALAEQRRAVALDPYAAKAHDSLANTLVAQGRLDEARSAYGQAMKLAPADAGIHSNRLYLSHYDPACGCEDILREHREWGERHGRPLQRFRRPHLNRPSPDRRLRIGYVSADFERHVAGASFLPPFREHDRTQFEIFCYANSPRQDQITAEYRAHCDGWREIHAVTDEAAVEMIRADGIDILVDLSSHTAGNRLLLFARKPAPVQATHLGAWSTTGLETMDYRLSDLYLDPPNGATDCYLEKTIRLPRSAWFYEPGPVTPEVSALPAVQTGNVTFSCRNNFSKVSVPAFELWMDILEAVPHSRLLMYAPEGSCRENLLRRLEGRGISPDRLEATDKKEPSMQFFSRYHEIDIALDPFPYCGWTTSCDALWMGVPVISLSGRTAMGRGGKTILSSLGLEEFVAQTPEQYLQIAVSLAGDLERLSALRSSLRERIERSPLRDATSLIRAIESGYREMWRNWCGTRGGG